MMQGQGRDDWGLLHESVDPDQFGSLVDLLSPHGYWFCVKISTLHK